MKDGKWLDVKTGPVESDGAGGYAMPVRVRIRWWRPSFWREVRAMLDVKPRWMAWPVVLWFMVRHGWKVNRGL